MFSLDRWQEILDTLLRNKLRTALTAFSMAWGIFMLVVLLGLGNGLQTGVQQGFADDATNSLWMFAGQTSVPAKGLPVGRRLQFRNADVETIDQFDQVEHITGRFRWGQDVMVRVGAKAQPFETRAVHPGHLYLEKTLMVAGRYLNERDLASRAKVVVIGKPVARFFFGEDGAIGQWIDINRIPFQVVGVFDDVGGEEEQNRLYIPITTAQLAFNGQDKVAMIMFTVGDASVDEAKALEQQAREVLAEAHDFAPGDPQAVRVRNNVENFQNFQQIFSMINLVMGLMGVLAIVAGIIGVSNIMMIVVRERTKEIGVRKALGATPGNIVGSIVQEAVFLTAAAGYLGMVAGVGLLALLESVLPPNEMFAEPRVDLQFAIGATVLLMIAGALAGLFPALAAARVNPIVALRDE